MCACDRGYVCATCRDLAELRAKLDRQSGQAERDRDPDSVTAWGEPIGWYET